MKLVERVIREALSSSARPEADIVAEVKRIARECPENVYEFYSLIILKLSKLKDDDKVLILATITDALFQRSSYFRDLVCSDIKTMLKLFKINKIKSKLSSTCLRYIASWSVKFGQEKKELQACLKYIRESLNIEVPDVQQEQLEQNESIRISSEKSKKICFVNYNRVLKEVSEGYSSIEDQYLQLEKTLAVLFPKLIPESNDYDPNPSETKRRRLEYDSGDDEFDFESEGDKEEKSDFEAQPDRRGEPRTISVVDGQRSRVEDDDDVAWEESGVSLDSPNLVNLVADAGLGNREYSIEISIPTSLSSLENSDNECLMSNMRELARQLDRYSAPRLREWAIALREQLVSDEERRLASSSSSTNASVHRSSGAQEVLEKVESLLLSIEDILRDRCRALLKKGN